MKEQNPKMHLTSLDSLFTTQAERDNADNEQVIKISIDSIHDFPNHPFKVNDDEDMNKLIESIQERGVYLPTIVRQRVNGDYEMISGHRRKHAAIKAGLKTIPCIVKNLTDDEATILMVDSNIQREELLPSEKAFAYKMKDVNEFIKELNINVRGELSIKLFANMKREVSIVEKDGDRLYVSYDKVKYFEKDESNSVYEEMLEIEDWKKPNTTDVDYDYDRHLIEVHNLISKAQLPIELTKDSKYFRGYTVLNKR